MGHRNVTFWGAIAAIAATLAFFAGPAAAETADAASASRAISSTVGIASYYGAEFNGRRTANGEIFDMHGLSAASKTLPLPCYARVTNLGNGRSVVVRVNDRGPSTSPAGCWTSPSASPACCRSAAAWRG